LQSGNDNQTNIEKEKSNNNPTNYDKQMTMDDPAVLSVIEMGYTPKMIEKALLTIMKFKGNIQSLIQRLRVMFSFFLTLSYY